MKTTKKKLGGARPGAGRKPADIPRRRHTIYCNMEEFFCIKAMITKLKEIEKAKQAINKAKGKKEEYNNATIKWLETEKEINTITIEQFRKAFQQELEKINQEIPNTPKEETK